jgi:hypothetical protein
MASEIELCFGNTEVKKSLLQIAHLHCHKLRCIAIGKPAFGREKPIDFKTLC